MLALTSGADAILNTYAPFSADDLARLERCKIIARYGIGVDNIDLEAATAAGIAVTNVPDYSIEEVAVKARKYLFEERFFFRARSITGTVSGATFSATCSFGAPTWRNVSITRC